MTSCGSLKLSSASELKPYIMLYGKAIYHITYMRQAVGRSKPLLAAGFQSLRIQEMNRRHGFRLSLKPLNPNRQSLNPKPPPIGPVGPEPQSKRRAAAPLTGGRRVFRRCRRVSLGAQLRSWIKMTV